jgi:hypothetical protein
MLNEFLRCLHDPAFNLPIKVEHYHELIDEIEYYGISPQVYHLLKSQGRLEQTALFFQVRLKQIYKEAMYQNIFIKSQTKELFSLLENIEVEVIPLKGVYFAERFFGHIGARGTSDIDILVKREDVAAAVECVKELGFLQEGDPIPLHFHISFSKRIPSSPIPLTIEIHWDVVKSQTARMDILQFWESAIPLEDYTYVKQLSDYHSFYMIGLHGWRHNLDSPKYYIDIIQMIHILKEKINYDTLLEDAKSHQTYKRMIRTLSIIYQQYPNLNKTLVFPYQKRKQYPTIFSREMISTIDLYKDFIDYQFFSYDTFLHNFIEVGNWMVPTRREITKELDHTDENTSYVRDFLFLYKQRLLSMVKALFVKTQ